MSKYSKYSKYSLFLQGKPIMAGTDMMDMGTGMALGTEKAICIRTQATHICLPSTRVEH
jgi:hypothetical protein